MKFKFIALMLLLLGAMPLTASAQDATPTPSAPGYLIVVGKTTDRAKIGAYAASLPAIYASHDAYYLAIGGAGRGVTWLEGPWQDRSLIFARFPSRSEIDAFWWGEPYRAAIRKRDNAGVFSVVALEGSGPTNLQGPDAGFLIVMTAPKDNSPRQRALSETASRLLSEGVQANGGTVLAARNAAQVTALEGDTVFDQFTLAVWPSFAARDAYLATSAAARAKRARQKLGLSVALSANGVPRTQTPPAATASPR